MRTGLPAVALLVLGAGIGACGGNDPAPTAPSPTGDVVTINVVAINGAQSFSPNPASIPAGQMVVWHNVDNTTHRVALNDRSIDTGNLAPGASSQAMALPAVGPYHCTIHPEMTGTVTR
jgi:plastocyanin